MSSPTQQPRPSKATTMLYKPVSLASSVAGGMVANAVFKKLWRRMGSDDRAQAPGPMQQGYSTREILIAAVLQGAIFSLVTASFGRLTAMGFRRAAGEWPT